MNRIFIKDIVCLYPHEVSGCIDTNLYLLPREKRKLDRYSQISLAISKKIHECNPDFFEQGEDISVLSATCFGAMNTITDEVARYHDTGLVSPVFITKILSNMQAAVIAIALQLKGANYTVSTGVNSSCDAVIDGYELIMEQREGRVLVVSSDSWDGEFGAAVHRNYCQDDVKNFGECGAALLLDLQSGNGALGEITEIQRGILHKHESIFNRLHIDVEKKENGSHGIYLRESRKLVTNLPFSSGSQTIFDIKKGIEYCRDNKEKEFIVYTISKKMIYSAITIKCVPN